MESLLANYASSDEEEQEQQPSSSKTSSLFSSLPQPKSSSLFQSLPQPKQTPNTTNALIGTAKSSSIFSSLPPPKQSSKPKSQIEEEPATRVSSSGPTTKKVVQFRPPIIPLTKSSVLDDDDDDEEDDGEKEENRRKKLESMPQTPSVKSFLSSIPAPRNSATLGVQTSSGSGRRSILEADAPASNADDSTAASNFDADQNAGTYANYESYGNYQYGTDQNPGYYMDTGTAGNDIPTSYYVNNDTYASYNTYGDYGQYGNNWADGSGPAAPEISGISDIAVKVSGKRGRNEIPSEIIEVKQEELIKNRPREDQVKLTGIAFGPAYQPVSAKGKPSKLHKRKHQIGSLYFDMKQKEMELTERRAKGMLTKAETQAKYGW
ncbi:proline-rich protein PRCC [Senna tora]|uniref:Proline-rich protein PRCC n=1 Tax=Senna tora TaxID=362788 RepID=A0A834X4T5_9FABA|nr:proline-rich protein PRCC [Senna tora]